MSKPLAEGKKRCEKCWAYYPKSMITHRCDPLMLMLKTAHDERESRTSAKEPSTR